MDESTALIFSVVLSYVLLTVVPMGAELLLLPGKGGVFPDAAGSCPVCRGRRSGIPERTETRREQIIEVGFKEPGVYNNKILKQQSTKE